MYQLPNVPSQRQSLLSQYQSLSEREARIKFSGHGHSGDRKSMKKHVSSLIADLTNAKDDLIDVHCGEVYEEKEEVYNEE